MTAATLSSSFRRTTLFVGLCTAVLTAPGVAGAGGVVAYSGPRPSAAALQRLEAVETYIDYFTSLSYGPAGSRIPAAYIRALIVAESGANRWARSHKGARGLAQIMPHTGRKAAAAIVASGVDYEYVDEAKLASFHTEYLHDVAINVLIACYLSALYHDQYGGRTDLVAAAWNAGTGAVERYGNRPPPYGETRGLLQRVHDYMTFFQDGRVPSWSVERWDTYGFDAPGWDLDWEDVDWSGDWQFPDTARR